MVYNPQHDFLFIHIQKNAGTSVTQALMNIPGSRFITPAHLRFCDLTPRGGGRPLVLAVVRDPWSRLVSWYEMMLSKGIHNDFSHYLLTPQPLGFSEFIRRVATIRERAPSETSPVETTDPRYWPQLEKPYTKSLAFNQIDYLCEDDGNFVGDYVMRFDSLATDWLKLSELIPSLQQLPPLGHQNKGKSDRPWQHYYQDPKDIAWVTSLYSRDLEKFRFRFQALT